MKILITGGAGFIGSHLVDALIARGHDVVVLDNLSGGKRENLHPEARFYLCDIADVLFTEKIFRKERPVAVFHLAARISVRASIAEPLLDAHTNILGSINIIRLAHRYGAKKIIAASTGGVMYGDTKKRPTPETVAARPLSPYAIAKLTTDTFLEYYHRVFGLPYAAIRCGNVYGPRQNPHGEAGVIAIFLEAMLRGENPVINGAGTNTRDYVYIDDVVNAYLAPLESPRSGVYNIGTGRETSTLEIFRFLNAHFDDHFAEYHGPEAIGEQEKSSLSISKAKKELGWKPSVSLEEGIAATVSWALENQAASSRLRWRFHQIPFFLPADKGKLAL